MLLPQVLAFPLKQLKEAANALGLMHASSKKEAMTDQIFSALIQEVRLQRRMRVTREIGNLDASRALLL